VFRTIIVSAVASLGLASQVLSQTTDKVDFARDVQPIFHQNCLSCHGPKTQNAGLRVDRRSSVLKPGTRRVIPGGVENSLLYYRISGTQYGLQMPPTGALPAEQVKVIRTWIEQGADWPDGLANETELPPLNPKAVALVDTLRSGDRTAFSKIVTDDPKLLDARGPESSTPFMYAVLYTDASTLERLIKLGADVNRRNDAGATALLWAALDSEKTRVLLAHGADVNAKSEDGRTPLMVAASRPGNLATVKMLLAKGANANVAGQNTPLTEASLAGDAETMQALLAKGAEAKGVGGFALANSAGAGCAKCIELLVASNMGPMDYTMGLMLTAVQGDPKLTKLLIDHGADVNAVDPAGRTALMYAAVSDLLPAETVKLLLEKGAKADVKSTHSGSGDTGKTALDLALMHGRTPVSDLLFKSAGVEPVWNMRAEPTRQGNLLETAVTRSLALLQRTDASFVPKAGCFSCHNQSLEAIAVAQGRKSGFKVDEGLARRQVKMNAGALTGARDILHQGTFVPGINANPAILAYVLLGLDAEGYKGDLTTDAVAMFLQSHQMPDGHWAFGPEARPPLCADSLGQTVLAMRGLQLYAPPVDKAAYAKAIQQAATWIGEYRAQTNYDLAWRLQGLVWGGKSKEAILKARKDLLAIQNEDGGWSDIPSMRSGAFTTGLAMTALQSSGLAVSDAAYQRGVSYLLSTQHEDGSWHVPTRAAGFQPYFDNGFPYGVDQWISAAGSSLATLALELAAPQNKGGLALK